MVEVRPNNFFAGMAKKFINRIIRILITLLHLSKFMVG
jgi:hypothetical protein